VKHAQGESSLQARDLILIQFHGVDAAAAVLVIAGIRSEDARQQDAGFDSERMKGVGSVRHVFPPGDELRIVVENTLKDLPENEKI
jgi:hypothetical protein